MSDSDTAGPRTNDDVGGVDARQMPTMRSSPTLVSVVDDLFTTVAAEISGADSAEQGDALRVRAALLSLDGLGDRARAVELLTDAEHVLAPALRLSLGQPPGPRDRESLLGPVDWAVGAAYLFARGAFAEAAELADRGGPTAAFVRRVCLGLLGQWDELVRTAERDEKGDLIEEASAVALDRANDPNGAVALLRRIYDARPYPYVIERLLELGDNDAEVLRAKLERIEPSALPERAATMKMLADALAEGGNDADAEALITTLASATSPPGAFSLLVHRATVHFASKRGDWQRAAEAWEALARDSESPMFAGVYLRRAAELWESRVGAADRAEPLLLRLHETDPGDGGVASMLARLFVRRGAAAEIGPLMARLGASREEGTDGGLLLGASIAEAGGQDSTALWRDWADAVTAAHPAQSIGGGDKSDPELGVAARSHAIEAIARGLRAKKSRSAIIDHYRSMAPQLDPRRGAPYLAVAGALALDEGALDVASALFDEAASREPDDLLVHAGRVALYERTGRHQELAAALTALLPLVESTAAQASLHKKLARVSIEQLNDVATAHESYERLLEIDPSDVTNIGAFVRLCAEGGKWARAIDLAERAADLTTGERSAEMLRYAGELSERHLSDDDAALRFYERALDRSAKYPSALLALGALHKKANRLEDYLVVLKDLLEAQPTGERRIELLLEYARVAERADGEAATHDFGRAYGAYEQTLALDPAQPVALQGLERLCRAANRWEELAAVFAAAPESVRNVRVRIECMERLERWGELAKLREQELRLLEVPAEIAAAARSLADLYDTHLHNAEAAVRTWTRVAEAAPSEPEPLRAIQRLHEAAGRHADMAVALERELGIESIDAGRRMELWTRLGDLRRGPLQQAAASAQAYEEVLRIDPRRAEILQQLIEVYRTLGRGDDMARLLDVRAAAADDPAQRANVLREKAELLQSEGDTNGALSTYQEAFALDPESRACFTAYEKLCYKTERWKQAQSLYDEAIRLVEERKSRAYRLSDLYARRGQLQMQYLGALGEATHSYRRVLELDPENDAAQTALERILSAQDDWAGLLSVYEQRAGLLKTDARRVEVLRRAARVAATKVRDAAEAARLYEQMHAIDPTDSEAADTLERYYERTRQFEKLIALLRTRLSLTAGGEESIALYIRVAQLCEEGLRDADQTIEAYQKILEIAPSNREAIDALGRLYEGTERWAELVEVTRRQIRLVTDRAQKALLYFKCGSVMESKFGKEDDAIRYYDAAIKTSPSCLPAVHGLRDLHLRREEWPRVIQTLELEAKLWTEDKERAGVYAHIGQIYGERLNDAARAIQYFETALQVDRECLPANKALFDLYSARGDYQQALALSAVLTQKVSREGDPVERSEFYRKRSIVAEQTGDSRAAVDSLVVALEIRPDSIESLDMLVALCRSSPEAYDYDTTFRELEKVHRKRENPAALARVLVGQASMLELAYDIDAAEEGYLEALKLAPLDFSVVEPLVAFHERLRRFAAAEALVEAFLERATEPAVRASARLRLAALCGEAMMDSQRAADALGALLAEEPAHKEALYLYAQELFLLSRFNDAKRVAERLIEIVTSPDHTAPPEELARYYDYLGRILEAAGDTPASARAFRRAVDLDPTYPPAALALARRAAATGDLVQGTRVLADALESAEQLGNREAALTLQRTRARFLVTWGELALATQAFRALLERAPDSAEDRLAYADLLGRSEGTIGQAFIELERVLASEPRQGQAYRQLSQLYQRVGQPGRASRVHSLMTLMGIVDGADRPPMVPAMPRRAVLSDDLRGSYVAPGVRGPLTEALLAVREPLEESYPFVAPEGAVAVSQSGDGALRTLVQDLERVFGVSAEVFIAPDVPGGFIVNELPKPVIYLSQALIETTSAATQGRERRVLLGAALEALRGGYGLLTRVPVAARTEITNLLGQLVKPDNERSGEVATYVKALPRKSIKSLEKLWMGLRKTIIPPGTDPNLALPAHALVSLTSVEQWLDDLDRSMQRAALIASDDLGACARVFVRPDVARGARTLPQATASQAGMGRPATDNTEAEMSALLEELALLGDAVLSLDRGPKVADLTAFYLSETYDNLRTTIGDAA